MTEVIASEDIFIFPKQSGEKEFIAVDFSRRIPSGVTVVSYEVLDPSYIPAVGQQGTQAYADVLAGIQSMSVSNTTLIGGKKLVTMVSDGITGRYRVTFRVTLSDGQVKEDEVFVDIENI